MLPSLREKGFGTQGEGFGAERFHLKLESFTTTYVNWMGKRHNFACLAFPLLTSRVLIPTVFALLICKCSNVWMMNVKRKPGAGITRILLPKNIKGPPGLTSPSDSTHPLTTAEVCVRAYYRDCHILPVPGINLKSYPTEDRTRELASVCRCVNWTKQCHVRVSNQFLLRHAKILVLSN